MDECQILRLRDSGLDTPSVIGNRGGVRYKMTSAVVLSVLVLTANHATGVPPVSSASNPQATEAKAQETVDLKISGMT